MNPINLKTLNYGAVISYIVVLVLAIVIMHFLDKFLCKIKFLRENIATRIMLHVFVIMPLIFAIFFGIALLVKSLFF